jgi:hypothetical protein
MAHQRPSRQHGKRPEERPEAVALGMRLHQSGGELPAIGAYLERAGHVKERGRTSYHKSVRAMLE